MRVRRPQRYRDLAPSRRRSPPRFRAPSIPFSPAPLLPRFSIASLLACSPAPPFLAPSHPAHFRPCLTPSLALVPSAPRPPLPMPMRRGGKVAVISRSVSTEWSMISLVSTRVPTRAREALRRATYAPARAAASLPRRSLRFKSRRPRHARPGSCVTWRGGASVAEAAGVGGTKGRGSRAAGGGLPLEERRVRAADPACAHASRAGAVPGPDGPGGMPGVRGCVACRRRPGPKQVPEEHHRLASPITSRTTAGWTKDRRGGGDVHGSPGLLHGES